MIETALVFTFLWLGGAIGYIHAQQTEFIQLKPGELGEFLSGAFSPLAFGWFLITVLFQRREIFERISQRDLEVLREQINSAIYHYANCVRHLAEKSAGLSIESVGGDVRENIFGLEKDYADNIDREEVKLVLDAFGESIERLRREMESPDFAFHDLRDRSLRGAKGELLRIRHAGARIIELAGMSEGNIGPIMPIAFFEFTDSGITKILSVLDTFLSQAEDAGRTDR